MVLLNIMCWNVRGIMSSAYPLSQQLDQNNIDIALISEHKLLPRSAGFLNSIHQNYESYVTTVDSVNQFGSIRCGRAGTAILYKKQLHAIVDQIHNIDCDRIIGIEIKTQHSTPIYIFCVYLPACNDINLYRETVTEINALYWCYSKLGDVIIAGDFNGRILPDPIRNQPVSVKSKILTEFIKTSNLISVQSVYGSPESYTFIPNKTTIDHIFVEKSLIELIDSFTIVDEKDIVSSDHRPMLFSITSKLVTSSYIQPPSRIAWNRCSPIDTSHYNMQVDRQVQESICYQVTTETPVLRPNYIHELLTDIIHASAAKLPRSKFNKRAKPYWSAEVKAAHTSNRYYRKRWIEDGRPRTRDIQSYIRYKDAKREFRRVHRQHREAYDNSVFDELNRAAELDYRLFWKLLRKKSGKKVNTCTKLNVQGHVYDNNNVTEGFRQHFSNIFSNASFKDQVNKSQGQELRGYLQTNNSLSTTCSKPFTIQEVALVTKLLPKGKSPGHDGILYEHIIRAKQPIDMALTALFNSVLNFEEIPGQWKTSLLIPLYKGKGKDKSDPSSYRPVSLIPVFCKIFEKVLLNRVTTEFQLRLIDFPSNQQNGFQRNLSCLTTAFNMQETVYYQIENNSDVYVAFLDQKAAFDSVRHRALLLKLGRLGLVGKTLRIIQTSYTNLQCKIKLSNATSTPFEVIRGVRQGGVFSTFLYLVYVDQLLRELEISKHGAKVMSIKGGNPTFADDISLIAVSPLYLQQLVDIVYRYCYTWNIDINVGKSNTVVFTKRRSIPQVGILYGHQYIEQTDNATHLGILQSSNLKMRSRIQERLLKARHAFYSIVSQGVHPYGLNPLVSVSLYSKIVVPTALYGAELWNNLTANDVTSINRFQHFVVKNIQGFPSRTRSDMAESMLGLHKLISEVNKRKLMFLYKILNMPAKSITKEIFIRKYIMYVLNRGSVSIGFIPDICDLVDKYNLHFVLNDFFAYNGRLPSKTTWKNTVNNVIHQKETNAWEQRLSSDSEFCLFQTIHPCIKPAVVYKVYTGSKSRSIIRTVALLWCRRAKLEITRCIICNTEYQDELIHVISECTCTVRQRDRFKNHILPSYDMSLAQNLNSVDTYTWALTLLGAPLLTTLETTFLQVTFNLIIKCINIYLALLNNTNS